MFHSVLYLNAFAGLEHSSFLEQDISQKPPLLVLNEKIRHGTGVHGNPL